MHIKNIQLNIIKIHINIDKQKLINIHKLIT